MLSGPMVWALCLEALGWQRAATESRQGAGAGKEAARSGQHQHRSELEDSEEDHRSAQQLRLLALPGWGLGWDFRARWGAALPHRVRLEAERLLLPRPGLRSWLQLRPRRAARRPEPLGEREVVEARAARDGRAGE